MTITQKALIEQLKILERDANIRSLQKAELKHRFKEHTLAFSQMSEFLENEKAFYFSFKTWLDELKVTQAIQSERVNHFVEQVQQVIASVLQSIVAQSTEKEFLRYYDVQIFQENVLSDIVKELEESLHKIPAYIPLKEELKKVRKKKRGFSLIAAACLALLSAFTTPHVVEAAPKPLIHFSVQQEEQLYVKEGADAYIKDGNELRRIGSFPKTMLVVATKENIQFYKVIAVVDGTHQDVYVAKENTIQTQDVERIMSENLSASQYANFTKEYEGFRRFVYTDTKGYATIGYGTCVDTRIRSDAPIIIQNVGLDYNQVMQKKQSITQNAAEVLLSNDIQKSIDFAHRLFSDFDSYPKDMKLIIVDMIYNLGTTKIMGFKNTIRALREKNYALVAHEMKNSAWYSQVGRRSREHVAKVLTLASTQASSMQRAA